MRGLCTLGFFPSLLNSNSSWPALEKIYMESVDTILPLIASKNWVKNLKEIDLNCLYFDADELHPFLKALETGVVKSLTIIGL
jgi:hypothetical protein